jgi:hypothetical protein
MARRGKKRQLEVEARYWQLLAVGVGAINGVLEVTRKSAVLFGDALSLAGSVSASPTGPGHRPALGRRLGVAGAVEAHRP